MTPAERLRAAADLIERTGAAATPGPSLEDYAEMLHDGYEAAAVENGWQTQERSRKPWADVPEANKATMRAALAPVLRQNDAAWIALLGPDAAPTLAGMLREHACAWPVACPFVAFADLILRGQP